MEERLLFRKDEAQVSLMLEFHPFNKHLEMREQPKSHLELLATKLKRNSVAIVEMLASHSRSLTHKSHLLQVQLVL